jgi:hypothetical protein
MTGLAVVLFGVAQFLRPRRFACIQGNVKIGVLHAEPRARHADLPHVSAAHRRTVEAGAAESIDERTWTDRDLDDVFHSVEHAASEPGR